MKYYSPPPFNEELYDRIDKYMSTKLSLNNAVLTLSHLLASFLHSKELKTNTYHLKKAGNYLYYTLNTEFSSKFKTSIQVQF